MATTVRVSASIAVLSALDGGATTIKEIAKKARMTDSAVTQTLARLKKKSPSQVKRTNRRGFGVVAHYKITRSGTSALRKARQKLEV